ncbi:TPM domain-containing protein [Microbacterium caowuchunii]|uniref:TPM domain-containing protein n=1 Tax=Microbacterium caowuchunii TaxID=2614638 RepID=A0A5N0T9S5_9MICO|nr:TPM domain-containing protein [Microbacterium caowuchunii]KAA9130059.1 TPM domain-containing protein [Microbacterium caowuchunii]
MRPRWALALAAVFVFVFGAALPASATAPVDLGSGYVVDDAGVLSGAERSGAEARLETLAADTGLDLWVVYVDEFTDPSTAEDWANTTAERNGLGPTQYLLAIAVEARQFYLSGDSAGPLSEDQLATIEQQGVLPALRADDWSGAVEGAAAGIASAAGGGSGQPGGSSDSGGSVGIAITVIAVVAIVGVVIFFIIRSRRRGPAAVGTPKESTADLARRAAAALVQTDDALRTGEQELGFAAAQFPESATAPFTAALTESRAELDRAFTLRQQLDDDIPDTEEQVRAWHSEVLSLCESATRRLQEQAAGFDELRRLEQDAPAALERVRAARATADAEVGPAAARLEQLGAAYAASAVASVADNIAQARHRLGFADEQLAAADSALARGASGEAAVAIRSAEDATAQARTLAQAVGTLDEQLGAAAAQIPAVAAELERDIAAAGALPDPDGRLAAAVAAARAEAQNLRQASGPADPLATLQRLQSADEELDALLQTARDAAARAEHARQMLPPALTQAQAQISGAEDFIAARRGAVGATARTRLAEARAALGQALQQQAASPEQALASAQRASQLAVSAAESARGDVSAFAPTGGGGDMSAMLGGLVIGSMLGNNRRSSGFGGGFSGGGYRPRPGGSSRGRSGGGGFSGGGRSRRGGGRF